MNTTTTSTAAPLAFLVLFREHRPRARWKRVGVVRDRMAGLGLCSGKGDWQLKELFTVEQVEAATAEIGAGTRPRTPEAATG